MVLVPSRRRCNDGLVHPRLTAVIDPMKDLGERFTEHRNSLAAGGLAYFLALAVAPAAIVIGALTGLVLGPDQVRSAIKGMSENDPLQVEALKPLTDSLVTATEHASVSGVTVYAASKVVYGLRLALDGVFETAPKRRGLVGRVTATVITLIGMSVLVGALVALTVLPRVLTWLGFDQVRIFSGIGVVDWIISALLIWLATRWVLRHAPNNPEPIPWWGLGPIFTTLWLLLVSAGLGVYANFSTTLGSAIAVFGGVVVFLLWCYLGFLGLLLGAEVEALRQRTSAKK